MYQGNWSYDVENRLASVDAAGGERYMYDPSNKRVYKQTRQRGDLLLLWSGRQGDGRVCGVLARWNEWRHGAQPDYGVGVLWREEGGAVVGAGPAGVGAGEWESGESAVWGELLGE